MKDLMELKVAYQPPTTAFTHIEEVTFNVVAVDPFFAESRSIKVWIQIERQYTDGPRVTWKRLLHYKLIYIVSIFIWVNLTRSHHPAHFLEKNSKQKLKMVTLDRILFLEIVLDNGSRILQIMVDIDGL